MNFCYWLLVVYAWWVKYTYQQQHNVMLSPGVYTTIPVKLETTTTTGVVGDIRLTNESEMYFTLLTPSDNNYTITFNTLYQRVVEVQLALKCEYYNTNISDLPNEVHFTSNATEVNVSSPISITIENKPIYINITIKDNTTLYPHSISAIQITPSTYYIAEDITLTFKSSSNDVNDIQPIIIDAYTMNDNILMSTTLMRFITLNDSDDSMYMYDNSKSVINVMNEPKLQCVELSLTEIHLNIIHEDNNKHYSEVNKLPVITVTNTNPSEYTLYTSSSITNTYLFCAFIEANERYDDYDKDNILSHINEVHFNSKARVKYFAVFYDDTSYQYAITFNNVNRSLSFKYKCVYQNNVNFKYKENNNYKYKMLSLNDNNSTYNYYISHSINKAPIITQCAHFVFNDIVDIEIFTTKTINDIYSKVIFKYNDVNRNGCLNVVDDIYNRTSNTTHMCLVSDLICNSYPTIDNVNDIYNTFYEFISFYNTSANIESRTGISNDLTSLTFTNDSNVDQYEIYIETSYSNHSSNSIMLNITNNNTYDITCKYNNDSYILYNISNSSFTLSPNQNISLQVTLPSYTNDIYDIYFKCISLSSLYSLKSFSYLLNTTLFSAVKFNHTKHPYKPNCTDNPYNIRCINKTIRDLPKLQTGLPLDNTSNITEFESYPTNKKIQYISKLTAHINITDIENNLVPVLQDFVSYFIYLQNINCSSEINENCFITQRYIVNNLFDILIDDINITHIILNSNNTDNGNTPFNKEHVAKLALVILIYAGNNADAFDIETSYDLLTFGATMMNRTDEVVSFVLSQNNNSTFEENLTLTADILTLYMNFSSHIIDIVPFFELQIKDSIPKYKDFITDHTLINFKQQITTMLYHYTQYYLHEVTNENFNIKHNYSNFEFVISPLRSRVSTFIFDYINITLPLEAIYHKYASTASLVYTVIIVYNKYPLLSSIYSSGNFSNYIVSIAIINGKTMLYNEDIDSEATFDISYDISRNSPIKKEYINSYIYEHNELTVSHVHTNKAKDDIIVKTSRTGDIVIGSVDMGGKVITRFEVWMLVLILIWGLTVTSFAVYLVFFVFSDSTYKQSLIEKEKELKDTPLFKNYNFMDDDNKNINDDLKEGFLPSFSSQNTSNNEVNTNVLNYNENGEIEEEDNDDDDGDDVSNDSDDKDKERDSDDDDEGENLNIKGLV